MATQKVYISPIASKTVDAKLGVIMEMLDIDLSEQEDLGEHVRDVRERNDLNLENTEDAPYA